MSGDKFFLDTDVFVYAADQGYPAKARRAQDLIAEGTESRRGVVSYQVFQELVNVTLRKFARPIQPADLHRYLETVFRSLTVVHSSMPLYEEALRVLDRYRLSWCDSLIVAAALETDCGVLYSEDFQNGQRFGSMHVINPFE